MPDLNEVRCPACSGLQIHKRGTRKTKTGSTQLYQCKKCKKIFSCSALPNYSYPPQAVIAAPMFYYRGYSLEQTRQRIIGRFRVEPSLATVYGWIRKFGKHVGADHALPRIEKPQRTRRDKAVKNPSATEIGELTRKVFGLGSEKVEGKRKGAPDKSTRG